MDLEKDDIAIDETEEESPEVRAPSKGLGKRAIIILGLVFLLLAVGGYVGYTFLFQGKGSASKIDPKEQKGKEKMVLFSMEPFILNLSDPGRHLKVAVQLELMREEDGLRVKERVPKLRDTIIMLFSNKTMDAVSSPEGKFQLKDEILLRANQAMDKEVFKNVYFTEFVMQ